MLFRHILLNEMTYHFLVHGACESGRVTYGYFVDIEDVDGECGVGDVVELVNHTDVQYILGSCLIVQTDRYLSKHNGGGWKQRNGYPTVETSSWLFSTKTDTNTILTNSSLNFEHGGIRVGREAVSCS